MAQNNPKPVAPADPTPGTLEETQKAVGLLDAPTAPEPERAPMKELTGVEYIGTADVKTFTVADLAGIGVESREDLSWSAANDRVVPIASVTAAAADFLSTQSDFRVF